MNTDFLKDLGDKAKESMEPLAQINQLVSSSIQDTLKFQMESAKKYSEMASEQVKAFTAVKDAESLQEFFKGQMDSFSKLNEQMMSDLNALSEAGQKFREEFEGIVNPKADEKPAKAPATKATTKPKA